MLDDDSPFCPIPHVGYCVRERCNFWDEDQEECTAACFNAQDQAQSDYSSHPGAPCLINFEEDYD
jgi:hypothetical protein